MLRTQQNNQDKLQGATLLQRRSKLPGNSSLSVQIEQPNLALLDRRPNWPGNSSLSVQIGLQCPSPTESCTFSSSGCSLLIEDSSYDAYDGWSSHTSSDTEEFELPGNDEFIGQKRKVSGDRDEPTACKKQSFCVAQ